MLQYKGNYWNPICGKASSTVANKIAIHNDQIYYFDGNYYRGRISVLDKNGNCIRQSGDIETPRYGSYRSNYNSIAVTDDYIFLGPYLKTYMQIGNAVPPLMARGIAKIIKKYIS